MINLITWKYLIFPKILHLTATINRQYRPSINENRRDTYATITVTKYSANRFLICLIYFYFVFGITH